MSESRAKFIITAVDNATATLRNINRRVAEMTQPARDVQRSISGLAREGGLYRVGKAASTAGGSIAKVGQEATALAARLGVVGGVAGFAIKRGLIDTAAEFEKYSAILETVDGSQAAAKKSLAWVSDFATTTPYELDQVMQAFVRLRAYGMDPTNGLLRTLGDTGSAMGKDVMAAVEAIADAVTGENERLKEFGIKAETKGNRVRYAYTDREGKQQYKIVDKNNRKMIESTLTAIWNEKYAGAMDRQSKTWLGIWSNIKDQWTRFANMIMGSGLFDWMRGKLQGVLDRINQMAASGELQAWAKNIGEGIQATLRDLWTFTTEAWKAMRQVGAALVWLRDLFGGWRPVVLLIIGIMAGPFLLAMAMATKAVIGLGIALMATPVGWVVAAVAAVAAAAYGLYLAWDPIKKWWMGIMDSISAAIDRVVERVKTVISWLKSLVDWIPGLSGPQQQMPRGGPVSTLGGNVRTVGRFNPSGAAMRQAEVGGTIRLQIDSEGRPKVKEMRSSNRNVNFDVDAGMMLVGAH